MKRSISRGQQIGWIVQLTVTKTNVEPSGASSPGQPGFEVVGVLSVGDGSGVDQSQGGKDGDKGSLGESKHFCCFVLWFLFRLKKRQ